MNAALLKPRAGTGAEEPAKGHAMAIPLDSQPAEALVANPSDKASESPIEPSRALALSDFAPPATTAGEPASTAPLRLGVMSLVMKVSHSSSRRGGCRLRPAAT